MVMVAEGVEDADVLADLTTWQGDIGQGHHIARPMSADLFSTWLDERATPRSSVGVGSRGTATRRC